MTDHREMLEFAARALGIDISAGWSDGNEPYSSGPHFILLTGHAWNPGTNSGQCAYMCAALGIDTKWGASIVACGSDRVLRWLAEPCAKLEYRPAAWRLAALRVAAEIGKGMRG